MRIILLVLLLAAVAQAFRAPRPLVQALARTSLAVGAAATENPPQVFIGNMPFTVTEEDLKSLVSEKLGGAEKFASLKIAKDRTTSKSRGFGYVNFQSQQDAEEAVAKLSGLAIDGREFKVDLSVPREQRPPRTDAPRRERAPLIPADQSVFIGNLDFSVTDVEILSMCNDILGEGNVAKVRLATDRDTGEFALSLFLSHPNSHTRARTHKLTNTAHLVSPQLTQPHPTPHHTTTLQAGLAGSGTSTSTLPRTPSARLICSTASSWRAAIFASMPRSARRTALLATPLAAALLLAAAAIAPRAPTLTKRTLCFWATWPGT